MPQLLKCRGLATYDNELNLPEGSLIVADNIVIDKKDVANPRRGFADYGDLYPLDADRTKQLLEYKDRILRHYGNVLQYDSDGLGDFKDFAGTYSELEAGLRIKYLEANSNFFFTTNNGIKKISSTGNSEFTENSGYITNAGGPKGLDINGELVYDIGGFFAPSSKVAYRIVWGLKDVNQNLILGSPSSRFIITNTSTDISTREKTNVTAVADVSDSLDSTYFKLYDGSGNGYFVWYDTTGSTIEPVGSDTIGKTAVKVSISTNESAINVANYTGSVLAALNVFDIEVLSTVITVTNLTGDDTTDASDGDDPTGFSFAIVEQGLITEGQYSNVTISSSVPAEANTTDYFYQLYRTAIFSTSTGVSLDDIDPGDEMNLVYESGLTSADLSSGEITIEDTTPESFRESGAFLYTNPVTGGGILQANEKPPIANDMAEFRNSIFYANTKTIHRKQFNILSVSSFTSGVSKFVIGNNSAARVYTFVGDIETSQIICDTKANTTDAGYFLINSASNERRYFVWIDATGSTTEPSDTDTSGRIAVRVDISGDTSDAEVAVSIKEALDALDDFNATRSSATVTVDCIKSGNVDDIAAGITSPDPGATNWAFSVTNQGDGEEADTADGGDVLLSSLASIGQSIDESARSLVSMINRDSNGICYAYYLSGPDDLPGIVLLESRSLEDETFYIGVDDSNISNQFNPELSSVVDGTAIGTDDIIISAAHGFEDDDEVYAYNTDCTPALLDNYFIVQKTAGNFKVSLTEGGDPVDITIASSSKHGKFFKADVFSDNEVSPNRIYYSKTSQPESVPIVNYIDVGPKDSVIKRVLSLRDNLFVLKEEGVYIITGSIGSFSVRLLDNSVSIIAPDSATVLNNQIYMLSTQGVATISDTGVSIISRNIEDKILDATQSEFNHATAAFGVSYENDRAYLLWLPSEESDTTATQCYRFNTYNRNWTRWVKSNTCGHVGTFDDKLYLGSGVGNYIEQERKNNNRTDYADRELDLELPANSAITDNILAISSTADTEIGDVLVQTQYVSISKYNRLLKKLDFDYGLDDDDYFSTLELSSGADLTNAMTALVAKLNSDDSGETYAFSGATDFDTIKDEYNVIIGKLNNTSSDTALSDYSTITISTTYETIIIGINNNANRLTVAYDMPFLKGDIKLFKGYDCVIQWAPQHFGDAEQSKQVRAGSIVLNGNNFYSSKLSYLTDLDQDFEDIEFSGGSVGIFGGFDFGEINFGGEGSDIPLRTLIPRSKQRCRYITCKFTHSNAREKFNILGMTLDVRALSTRAYK